MIAALYSSQTSSKSILKKNFYKHICVSVIIIVFFSFNFSIIPPNKAFPPKKNDFLSPLAKFPANLIPLTCTLKLASLINLLIKATTGLI